MADTDVLKEILRTMLVKYITPYVADPVDDLMNLNKFCPLFRNGGMCCGKIKRAGVMSVCGKKLTTPNANYCTTCIKKIKTKGDGEHLTLDLVTIGNSDEKLYWNPANDQIYEMTDDLELYLIGVRRNGVVAYDLFDDEIDAAAALGVGCIIGDE